MKYPNMNLLHRQRGAVLVVSLLILMVLTFVAVTSMEGSSLSYKMSANSVYQDEAFNHSESTRAVALEVVDEYMNDRSWDNVVMPVGLIKDNPDTELQKKAIGEDTAKHSSLQRDLEFSANGIEGSVYVIPGNTGFSSGAGLAQYKGYSGVGIGAGASGSSFKFFEIRSKGKGTANASSWTASDYKYVK